MCDQSYNPVLVAIITAVGYDYSEWCASFQRDVATYISLVLTLSDEV